MELCLGFNPLFGFVFFEVGSCCCLVLTQLLGILMTFGFLFLSIWIPVAWIVMAEVASNQGMDGVVSDQKHFDQFAIGMC